MDNETNTSSLHSLNANVWIYPKAGGVQLYPKLSQGTLAITGNTISLAHEDGTQVLQKTVSELVKVNRMSSIMTLTFNDIKVQFDFRKPIKWYFRLLGPFLVLNKGWKEQLIAEKPFEEYFENLGLLKS